VGSVTEHADLCHRCADVVSHMPVAAE